MRKNWDNKGGIIFCVVFLVFCSMLLALYFILPDKASSGPYLNSTHGNTSYGVDRKTIDGVNLFPDYAIGNCAHCHEQHASVGGITTTPSKYVLFYDNYVSQTDAFCFKCHDNTTTYATAAIVNRSYSYRAGDWNSDTLNDILEAFTNPPSISSHNLGDIITFITGNWGYTADSNPCAACHNPHMALGDPANAGSSSKSSGTRGWPISLPSRHSKDNNAWGLWGDDNTERMNFYTANYQALYRYNTFSYLEPQGDSSATPATASANTTDFVTFCTDCHNATNTIYSSTKFRNLLKFDWNIEKHGKGDATDDAGFTDVKLPYSETTRYVLACTDCHEPHGSPNVFLIRKWVNNVTPIPTPPTGPPLANIPVTVTVTADFEPCSADATRAWRNLCVRCHLTNYTAAAHHTTALTTAYSCNCHAPQAGQIQLCIACHYHGSTRISLYQDNVNCNKQIYNGGEHLF